MRFCVNVMSISCRNFIESGNAVWLAPAPKQNLKYGRSEKRKKKYIRRRTHVWRMGVGCWVLGVCVRALYGTRCARKCEKWQTRRSSDVPCDLAIIKDNDIVTVVAECERAMCNEDRRRRAAPNAERWAMRRMMEAKKRTRAHTKAREIDNDVNAFETIQNEINGILLAPQRKLHGNA